jgi:hypothetical protein
MNVTSNHNTRQSVAAHICLTQGYVSGNAEGLRLNIPNGASTPSDTSYLVASNAPMTNWFSRWYMEEMIVIYFKILKQNGKDVYHLL